MNEALEHYCAAACVWPWEISSLTRLHRCSATARRARYLPICASKLLCKQQRWPEDMILHLLFFLGVLLLLQSGCTNVCKQWKKIRCVNAKWEHTAVKLFWILTNCLLFWKWKCGRWETRLLKPHAEVITKTEYVRRIFHSVAPWQTAGRGTLPWLDHRQRKANCRRDHSCRLQGEKCTVTPAGPSDGSKTDVCFRCGISVPSSLHPPAGMLWRWTYPSTLQPSDCPWGMDCFLGGYPLWGEQGCWQKSSAVVCHVLCADLHCCPGLR